MAVPGITRGGARCKRPVDTLCIYPTLLELCNIESGDGLDGVSIVPLLKDPGMRWDIPAISEFRRGQCAVRSERYRYIRYSDGTSELYDHSRDPGEWDNLSGKKHKEVIKVLARSIPARFAPDAPSKNAYDFDPHSYTWIDRKTGKITHGKKKK